MRYFILSIFMLISLPLVSSGGYKEDFAREFLTKPWAGEQVEESACISCHEFKAEASDFPQAWRSTIHYENNVSCHDCHGGDPKDPSMAMSHQRGFVGVPAYKEVPEFCGKCHIGILKNYLESGHGKALGEAEKGPNCVTCHGSHKKGRFIVKASIDIINEQLCTQCHSYDRAKIMKQALSVVEKKIEEIDAEISALKDEGYISDDDEKSLFSAHVQFRALFHTVDVSLVKERTDEFIHKLNQIEQRLHNIFGELRFRKNFSAFLMLLFVGMGVIVLMLSKTPKE